MDLPETCIDVEAALPLFVGSDLEPAEMDAVRFHLEGCEACGALARRAAAARAVLVGARDASAADGPSLWSGIRPVLASEGLIGAGARARASSIAGSSAGPTAGPATRTRMTRLQRLGIGSVAAAAAVLFAFTLAGNLGREAPAGTPLGAGSPVAPGGPAPAVAVSATAAGHTGTTPASLELVPDPVGHLPGPLSTEGTHVGWQRLRAARDGELHMLDVAGDYGVQVPTMILGRRASGTELVRGR